MRHDVRQAHLCARWRKRGMSCPFAPHQGEPDEDEPEDTRIPIPVPLLLPARRRLREVVRELMNEMEVSDDPSEVMADAIGRVLDQGKPAALPGMAEEAVSDTVRDRVFKIPDLPDVPPVGAPGRGAGSKGFAGGGFFFDATQRLFGLMKQVGPGVAAGGGEPGGGTGMGGGATG